MGTEANDPMITSLQDDLLSLAAAQAADLYGCDLDRLDPEHLDAYLEMVTADNLEELASDLAAEAWQAY
jgi:hypothetical protein